MTGEPTTAAEEAGKEHEESFWASFTRADMKLLLVTFAGTVAANVVTVMVVAIALLLARPPAGARAKPAAVLLDLGIVVIGVMTVNIGLAALRRWRPKGTTFRGNDMVMLALTVVMGLFTLIFLLVLLGYAVGVK